MSLAHLAHRFGKVISDNSPAILSAMAVGGVVTTAYLTGRASFKAADELSRYEPLDGSGLPLQDKIKHTWKLYIPAAGTGLITIAAIIGANRIGLRRAAAMATAFTLSERAFENYKDKIVEKLGENKERNVRDELAQDAVDRHPPTTREIIITDGGQVLCCDGYSGRYFTSSVEDLKQAQNNLNYRVLNDGYASLSEFYNLIGLSSTSHSDEVGWSSDKMLELDISTTLTPEQKPCIYFKFYVAPIRDYDRCL